MVLNKGFYKMIHFILFTLLFTYSHSLEIVPKYITPDSSISGTVSISSTGNSTWNNFNVTGTLTGANVDLNSGNIDGIAIGQTTPSNAIFGITTSTTGYITTINSTNINSTNVNSTNANATNVNATNINVSTGDLELYGSSGGPSNSFKLQYNSSSGVATIAPQAGGNTELSIETSLFGTPTEAIRIDPTGEVGIGTSGPARPLHIVDVMRLEPRSTAPSSPSTGDIYVYDGNPNDALCVYLDLAWTSLGPGTCP